MAASSTITGFYSPTLIVGCRNSECANEGKLFCSKCHKVQYCGKECQIADWRVHKVYCKHMGCVQPPKIKGFIAVRYRDPVTNEITQLRQEKYLELTGSLFSSRVVCPKELMSKRQQEFASILAKESEENRNSQQILGTLTDENPKVVLVQEPPMGLGLIAGEDIQPFEPIAWFGGVWCEERSKTYLDDQYNTAAPGQKLKTTHSKGVDGHASYANSGPPNVFLNTYQGDQALISLCPIKKGSSIHLHYGPHHSIYTGLYFISDDAYQTIVAFLIEDQQDYSLLAQQLYSYIFSVPQLLVKVILEGHLSVVRAARILPGLIRLQPPGTTLPLARDYPMLLALCTILEKESDASMKQAFINLSDEISINTYLYILGIMTTLGINAAGIPQWTELGVLMDQIILLTHGTLSGSYLEKSDPFPSIEFNKEEWMRRYQTLPHFLREQLAHTCQDFTKINFSNKPVVEEIVLAQLQDLAAAVNESSK